MKDEEIKAAIGAVIGKLRARVLVDKGLNAIIVECLAAIHETKPEIDDAFLKEVDAIKQSLFDLILKTKI